MPVSKTLARPFNLLVFFTCSWASGCFFQSTDMSAGCGRPVVAVVLVPLHHQGDTSMQNNFSVFLLL